MLNSPLLHRLLRLISLSFRFPVDLLNQEFTTVGVLLKYRNCAWSSFGLPEYLSEDFVYLYIVLLESIVLSAHKLDLIRAFVSRSEEEHKSVSLEGSQIQVSQVHPDLGLRIN